MEIPSLTGAVSSGQTSPTAITSPLLRGALGTIAQRLGSDQTTVEAALAKGASLDELAARHGISSVELQTAVVADIGQARAAAGQAPIDSETLARMVQRAFAQGRRRAPVSAAAPHVTRDPLAIYGAAGRVVGEPAQAGVSVLA